MWEVDLSLSTSAPLALGISSAERPASEPERRLAWPAAAAVICGASISLWALIGTVVFHLVG
jgi:hypothetical protein